MSVTSEQDKIKLFEDWQKEQDVFNKDQAQNSSSDKNKTQYRLHTQSVNRRVLQFRHVKQSERKYRSIFDFKGYTVETEVWYCIPLYATSLYDCKRWHEDPTGWLLGKYEVIGGKINDVSDPEAWDNLDQNLIRFAKRYPDINVFFRENDEKLNGPKEKRETKIIE